MKSLHLNLASRPYRDYRPVYLVVIIASLLTFALALYNADTYLRYRTETVSTRAAIDKVDADAAHEEHLADDAARHLKSVNVQALSRQAAFVNAQIAERTFSWSALLDRLEVILTDNTRITQIAPTFDKTGGGIHLELLCEAKSSEGMVTMLNRFNRDSHFSNPFPRVETATPTGYVFSIGVEYKPSSRGESILLQQNGEIVSRGGDQ